jgi:hypothetical protein
LTSEAKVLLPSELSLLVGLYFRNKVQVSNISTIGSPLSLQVVSVQDVSQPSKVSGGGSGHAPRLLRVRLTDGHVTATAIEYQPVPALSTDLPPGTKVMLLNRLLWNVFFAGTPCFI